MIRLGANEIKVFFAACLYYSGLVKLARWWMQRSGQRLIILNYHGASEGDLRSHLLYLRRHYRMLHLEKALEELYTSKGTERVARGPCCFGQKWRPGTW